MLPLPTLRNQLADHLEQLNPAEFKQLIDLSDYLGEKANPSNPSGHLPEGSISNLLNRQSPATRKAFNMLSEIIETPREMPFQPKQSEGEILDSLGFDAASGTAIKAALDTSHVLAETIDRLGGSDGSRPDEPLTRRDIVAAAFDQHSQGD
jgi:hypothetical protein